MYRQAGRARCNGSRLASWPLRHAGRATQAFASAEGGFDAIVSLCGEFWFFTRRLFPLKAPIQDARCALKARRGARKVRFKGRLGKPVLGAWRTFECNAPPSAPRGRDGRARRYLQLAVSRRLCRARLPLRVWNSWVGAGFSAAIGRSLLGRFWRNGFFARAKHTMGQEGVSWPQAFLGLLPPRKTRRVPRCGEGRGALLSPIVPFSAAPLLSTALPAEAFRKSPAKIKRAALCREAWRRLPT
ncbi:hypothetical protein TRVL_09550 [Trypanosoma vivax]|nr:hypothetical protein TRVL_09550 [Trypanosoma vivax]